MSTPAVLALEDGTVFRGVSVGAKGNTTGEVVFNTAMTGYQEILTDPSYCRQIVTLTYPHIGNTGTNPEDLESPTVYAAGLVIRDLPLLHSNWRAAESLEQLPAALQGGGHRRHRHAQADPAAAREGRPSRLHHDRREHRRDRRRARRQEISRPEGDGSRQGGVHQENLSMERRGDLEVREQTAAPAEPGARGGVRLRDQAQYSSHPLRVRVPHDGGARANAGRSGARHESRRHFPRQRPGRSRALRLRHRGHRAVSARPTSRSSGFAWATSCWGSRAARKP